MSKKRKKPKPVRSSDSEAFELAKPTEEIQQLRRDSSEEPSISGEDHSISTQTALQVAEAKYKVMAWKGLEEEEEEQIEEGFWVKKEPIPEDELDMTPMVDVTFLLLIFFMVTASFSLQKSIQQPPAQTDDATVNPIDEIIVEDYVEIVIDQNDNYYVTSRDEEESEAPSDREMRSRLKDAKENSNATRLVIKAHLDCRHRKVVTVWDAGIAVGMNKIEIQTTELDY